MVRSSACFTRVGDEGGDIRMFYKSGTRGLGNENVVQELEERVGDDNAV